MTTNVKQYPHKLPPTCSCDKVPSDNPLIPLVPMILVGVAPSLISRAIFPALTDLQLLQVSHGLATILPEENTEKKSSYFQVRPKIFFEVDVIVSVLKEFGWSHVSAFASTDFEHSNMFNQLKKRSEEEGICLAIQGKFSSNDEDAINDYTRRLQNSDVINVVVLIADTWSALAFYTAVNMAMFTRHLCWIVTSEVGVALSKQAMFADARLLSAKTSTHSIIYTEAVPSRELAHPHTWTSVREMLKNELHSIEKTWHSELNGDQTLIDKSWQEHFDCKAEEDNQTRTLSALNEMVNADHFFQACAHKGPAIDESFGETTNLLFLIEAFYLAARSLRDCWTEECGYELDKPGQFCRQLKTLLQHRSSWKTTNFTDDFLDDIEISSTSNTNCMRRSISRPSNQQKVNSILTLLLTTCRLGKQKQTTTLKPIVLYCLS